jgi:septal ring factor EnvC (AmiA/AmiB activator)
MFSWFTTTIATYIIGGMALVLTVSGIGGYVYFNYSQNKITTLEREAQLKDIQLEQQKLAIESLEKQAKKVKESHAKLSQEKDESAAKVEDLREKFKKNDRDISKLAYNKPKLVENVINRATKNALRCMEIASGSPLTESEQDEMDEKGRLSACRP